MSQALQDIFFVALVAVGFVAFFRGFDRLLKLLEMSRRCNESSHSAPYEK